MSNRVGLRLSPQSRLLCLVLVHVLFHVLKAWARGLFSYTSPLSGSRGHSPVTLIFLPTAPRKPSSESYSSSIELWMTNSVSLGSNLMFLSGPLTCGCLIYPPYFQAVFVNL